MLGYAIDPCRVSSSIRGGLRLYSQATAKQAIREAGVCTDGLVLLVGGYLVDSPDLF